MLTELSIPWNREQTDSLTQVITEAGPRYQKNQKPGLVPGFFVPAYLSGEVRFTPESSR